jgi:alkyl hydroperoxide reductase subunit AhpF
MIRYSCFLLAALLFLPSCGEKEETAQESLLREKDREFIQATLGPLEGQARLLLVTSREDCDFCSLTEGFLNDIAALAPGIGVEVISLEEDGARAGEFGIERAPGIAILGEKDHGIRYYGLPTGYEFNTFIEAIAQVVRDDPRLLPETVTALAALDKPVTLTVFSTKT